jgi:hypothetical protein
MNTSNDEKPTPVRPPGRGLGPMPWLRLWHEFLDSQKVQRVTEALRARYVNLLCVACKHDKSGQLPIMSEMAFLCRLDEATMQETVDALVNAKLIDRRAKSYWINDWEQWQYGRSKAAEKQKRYRDKRNASRNGHGNAVGNALRNESVTIPSRARELEKEKDLIPSVRPSAPPEHPHANGEESAASTIPLARRELAERNRQRREQKL